jgi:hypothetical protein
MAMWWLIACSGERPLADATRAAAPHYSTFARFERWAQRIGESDVRLRGPDAVREATFAPLRSEPDVLWAELEADRRQMQLATPLPAKALHFVRVDAPEVGALKVALAEHCGVPGSRANGQRCVVLAREPGPSHPSTIRIAFRLTEPASSDTRRASR